MRLVLFHLFFLLPFICSSQDWAPTGAIWHYRQSTVNPYLKSYTTIESVGDTTINGQPCKVLSKMNHWNNNQEFLFMHYDSNQVYYYDNDSSRFCLLYDFNASAGDTFELGCFPSENGGAKKVMVDSVSSINVNGHVLKMQFYNSPGIATEFTGWVIEKIGHQYSMFPTSDNDYFAAPLRCYEDSMVGKYINEHYYYYEDWNQQDCEQIIYTSIDEVANSNVFISPNPTHSLLQISLSNPSLHLQSIRLFGLAANEVLSMRFQPNTQQATLNTQHLPSGIYFCHIILSSGERIVKKVVIE